MSWAQRLKRVFQLDVTRCDNFGGKVRLISCIEDEATIYRILDHLERRARGQLLLPALRAE